MKRIIAYKYQLRNKDSEQSDFLIELPNKKAKELMSNYFGTIYILIFYRWLIL